MSFSFVNQNMIKEKSNIRGGDNVNCNNDFRSNQRGDNRRSYNNLSRITNLSNDYRNSRSNNNRNGKRNERLSSSYESDCCRRRAPRYDSHSRSCSRSRSHDSFQETSFNRHRHGSDKRSVRRSRMTRSRSPRSRHDEPSSKRRRIMFGN